MIKIVQGDILEAEEDVIGHQVNCKGVMGAGLAKQLKERYRNNYEWYRQYCRDRGYEEEMLLGHNLITEVETGKYISNIFGQNESGAGGCYTDYGALKRGLIRLERFARRGGLTVALPYGLGAGLAGGDWEIIYRVIDDVFQDMEVTLYKIS